MNKSKDDFSSVKCDAVFPQGERGSSEYFTGVTWVQMLVPKEEDIEYSAGNVVFEAGARTNWHMHPAGQTLLVTEGNGFYQEKGKPAQAIKKGDVIRIPPDTEHWHGASSNSCLVHIALTNYKGGQNVIWLKPITEEEYKKAGEQGN
jgi:quercetin dioxygenase-like cupin family protein